MTTAEQHSMYTLTGEEIDEAMAVYDSLSGQPWARDLLNKLQILPKWRPLRNDFKNPEREKLLPTLLTNQTRSELFELRWAYALWKTGLPVANEIPTIPGSRVDFRVASNPPWLLELTSSTPSARAKETVRAHRVPSEKDDDEDLHFFASEFQTGAEASTEYEVIRLQGQIYEKVCSRKDEPRKFPEPESSYHAIIVDARGFEDGFAPDLTLLLQAVYGPRELEERGQPQFILKIGDEDLYGVFDQSIDIPQARLLRSRVHLIAVCGDNQFGEGALVNCTDIFVNPFLSDAGTAAEAFPLKCKTHRRSY